jgi:KDO2-lipid IV(A) lauroyltransferase
MPARPEPRVAARGPGDLREGKRWTRRQRWKNDAIYGVVRLALGITIRLPRSVLRALGWLLGAAVYLGLGSARRRARERLAAGLGAPPPEARVMRSFLAMGAVLADTVALLDPDERPDRTLALDDDSRAAFREALAEGRGVVFVAAHLGPWERMAALLAAEGFPVATVARESYDPRLTAIYERIRAPRGVRSIYRGAPGAAVRIARELRQGRAVGFLVDLPGRAPAATARLFGEPARIAIGPARIALARGAAVVVGTPAGGPLRGGVLRVEIRRIPTHDLGTAGAARRGGPRTGAERVLLDRLAAELDRRLTSAPEAWLGLYAPADPAGQARPEDTGFAVIA